MKKILSFILAFALVLSVMAVPALAENTAPAVRDAADINEALNVEGGTLVFVNDETYPWTVDGDAAKSGNAGVGNSESSVRTTVTANEGDVLQFDWISMGEGSDTADWDGLRVYVDSTKILEKGANHPNFERFAYVLSAGEHEIRFTFKKDSGVNGTGDYAKIDNVSVAAPAVPESIVASDVEVPVNRTASVSYTVLPDEAINKSVTFTIADESVATVDANGVVRGVVEGSTTLTIASVASPDVTAEVNVNVVPGPDPVKLFGASMSDLGGTGLDGKWISFMDNAPGAVSNAGDPNASVYAAAFAGGKVYGYTFVNGVGSNYFIMDTETMKLGYSGYTFANTVYGMAYDHSTDTMFVLYGNYRYLGAVDLATGQVTYVASLSGHSGTPYTFAIDGDGTGYIITNGTNARLYKVNLATGACTLVGSTGVALSYLQSMTWDHNTDQLFWASVTSQTVTGLYVLDPETAAATSLGVIGEGGHEVVGLFTMNDIEIPPVEFPDAEVTFVDGVDGSELGSMTVAGGTVLNEADFPTPPEHEGLEFARWDYDGAPVYSNLTITARYLDPTAIVWDFETNPWELGFDSLDADGDGFDWGWSYDIGATTYEGKGVMQSDSYINGTGALNPDNWLITPPFRGSSISFLYCGQDPSWAAEYFGVYVSTDGGASWGEELASYTSNGAYQQCVVDLSEYEGQSIMFAIRHYNCTNQFKLNIDYICITGVKHEVTFVDGVTGDTIETVLVDRASAATAPEVPEHFGYTFIEWDTDFSKVTDDITVTAIYELSWDVDQDGDVDTADALAVMRHVMNIEQADAAYMDADGNGEINITDALLIMRFALGID